MLDCCTMSGPTSSDNERRVISFRRRTGLPRPAPSPVKDLGKYERSEPPDDYRHRMLVNMAAFAFVLVLIAVGLWLAETMAQMRRNQDCVLSGRRGCTPVEVHREQP
jgi:hypothetical protein